MRNRNTVILRKIITHSAFRIPNWGGALRIPHSELMVAHSDARPASQYLFGKHKSMLLRAKVLIKPNDAQSETLAFVCNGIFFRHEY